MVEIDSIVEIDAIVEIEFLWRRAKYCAPFVVVNQLVEPLIACQRYVPTRALEKPIENENENCLLTRKRIGVFVLSPCFVAPRLCGVGEICYICILEFFLMK